MFVELFLQQLSASIARAAPIRVPSRDRVPRDKTKRDKTKADRRRIAPAVLPDQPLGSLADELERLLGRTKPHQVPVLRARLGFDGPRTTLEVAARLTGVTRERARQLETKFLSSFL